jgi:hypothetical protein
MRSANAINVHRKSGEAERRDLRFRGPFVEMFFDRAEGPAVSLNPKRRSEPFRGQQGSLLRLQVARSISA